MLQRKVRRGVAARGRGAPDRGDRCSRQRAVIDVRTCLAHCSTAAQGCVDTASYAIGVAADRLKPRLPRPLGRNTISGRRRSQPRMRPPPATGPPLTSPTPRHQPGPPDATRASWVKSLRAAGARPLPQISVSDEAFRELGVEFLSAREGIKVAELNELFNLVSPADSLRRGRLAILCGYFVCCICS